MAARVLARDPDQGDDVIGFHVQQTVEKSVKAVLASLDVDYPRTHDIDYLVRQLVKRDVSVPEALLEARWVSMWGVFTRYDDLETVLDRGAAIDVANVALEMGAKRHPDGARPLIGLRGGYEVMCGADSRAFQLPPGRPRLPPGLGRSGR